MSTKNLHPNTAKIELEFPLTVSGVEVHHLIMRKPVLRDMIAAQKMGGCEGEMSAHLVANLCEIPYEEVVAMELCDWDKCEAQVVAFKSARFQKTS